MSGVCWAQPPQHSHTVRGTGFHGFAVQSRGPGNLPTSSWAALPYEHNQRMCVLSDICSRQRLYYYYLHMQTNGSLLKSQDL